MAEKLTIQFSAKGEKKLINALKGLASAQNRLDNATKKVSKSTAKFRQRVDRNTKSVSKLQSAIGIYRNKMLLASFAISLVSKALVSFVQKAGIQEDSVIRLAQVFGGEAAVSLNKFSSELQKNSIFGDESINMIMSQIGAFGASVEQTKSKELSSNGTFVMEATCADTPRLLALLMAVSETSIPSHILPRGSKSFFIPIPSRYCLMYKSSESFVCSRPVIAAPSSKCT